MNLTLLLLIAISIIFTVRNIAMIKKMSVSKGYKEIYHAVVSREENIIEKIKTYIDSEKDEYYKNKARIFLIYNELLNDIDPSNSINDLDIKKIFLVKDKYNKNHISLNSDMFAWMMVCFVRLQKVGKLDELYDKFKDLDDTLINHVEYKTFKAAYAFVKNDKENSKFLNELVNGEYSGMFYDKQLIGLTKRVALSYIASDSKEKNIEYQDELGLFAKSYLGSNLLKDLDIYEVYKPNETN